MFGPASTSFKTLAGTPQLGQGASIVLKYCQIWNAPAATKGVRIIRMKRELVMAKKMLPRGERKKRMRAETVRIVGNMLDNSSFPPGPPDGGSWKPIWREVEGFGMMCVRVR